MRFAYLVSPIAPPHGQNGQLSKDDGPSDGGGYFLGALHTKADMTIVFFNGNKCLEPASLPIYACFCTDMIFKISLRDVPRETSKISDSLMGKEKRYISYKDLIFMFLNRWPSLVTGSMSSITLAVDLALALPQPWMPLPKPQQKLQWPSIPGSSGPPDPPASASSHHLVSSQRRRKQILK